MDDRERELRRACVEGDVDDVQRLLLNGGDINLDCRDRDGLTPLHYASIYGHTNVVRRLIDDGGANIHCANDYEQATPLHFASRNGHGDTVRLLLERGANVHGRAQWGSTPLLFACVSDCRDPKLIIDVLHVLFDWGADADCQDNNGNTPLHHATKYKTDVVIEVVRFLVLEKVANIDSQNSHRETPLDCARRINNQRMVELFTSLRELLHATLLFSIIRDNPTRTPLSQLRTMLQVMQSDQVND